MEDNKFEVLDFKSIPLNIPILVQFETIKTCNGYPAVVGVAEASFDGTKYYLQALGDLLGEVRILGVAKMPEKVYSPRA